MCLVAVAWQAHPRYPLIIAGNRDEFHARPTRPAGWWTDTVNVLGGRDEVAGGSWLLVSRSGRVAVVINDPRRPPAPERPASRGHLVRDFVSGDRPSGRFLDAVAVRESRYAGFCLLVGTAVQMRGFVTSRAGSPHRWTLKRGVSVFSNSPLEAPWPKAAYLEARLQALLLATEPDREAIFALLREHEPTVPPNDANPLPTLTPFIAGETYGTRASTLVSFDAQSRCEFEERRFGAGGIATGVTQEQFSVRN